MKRQNGENIENIILSSDITIEGGTNKGKNLEEVLEQQNSEIEKLKSNVKWIYKYGGVGGNGKGGGPSSSWSIFARLGDMQVVDKETLVFPQADQYNLLIRINNPSGGTFMVSYSYMGTGGNNISSKKIRLDIENSWTLEEKIYLGGNHTIRIDVEDENAEIKSIESNYITQSYTLNYRLVTGSGMSFVEDRIFMSNLKEVGLQAEISYEVIEGVSGFTYEYIPFGGTDVISNTISTEENKTGTISLKAFYEEDIDKLPDDFIGTFSSSLKVTILGKESKFTRTLSIFPDNLYLQVEPITGEIYSSIIEELDNITKYLPGVINFLVTAYCGSTLAGRNVQYSVYTSTISPGTSPETVPEENWIEVIKAGSLIEQTPVRVSIRFSIEKAGWNVIKFSATNLSNGESINKYVYVYIDQFSSQLNWYPKDLQNDIYRDYRNYFRDGFSGESDPGFHINSPSGQKVLETISMNINSDTILLFPDNVPGSSPKDCVVHIGIQYNSTSDETQKILDIAYYEGDPPTTSQPNKGVIESSAIDVYQNNINIGPDQIGKIYLGTELENYDAANAENYHLITICRRFVGNFKGSGTVETPYFELCVYIDGVLETVAPNFTNLRPTYNLIRLYKNNYSINTLELSYYPHNDETFEDYITDTGVVHYWYTYKEQLQRIPPSSDIVSLLESFEGDGANNREPGVKVVGTRVSLRSGILDDIVTHSDIPVMVLTYNESGVSTGFFEWSDTQYKDASLEEQSNIKKTVGVRWAAASESTLTNINYENTTFSLGIQGSSTKAYSSKNYTLKLMGSVGENKIPLFSPNFNSADTSTFLPEQSFTLKADVVDSSHSNNTCMGSFINKVTQKYRDSTLGNGGDAYSEKYSNFIKNCLEGFPFLLFIEIYNENGISSTIPNCYYLGIYNFNLGRDSYFNLGYSDVSQLPDGNLMGKSGEFRFCSIDPNSYSPKSTFTCAEIAFNEGWFDFSVYDKSILFSLGDGDTKFMFDDIKTGEQNPSTAQNNISEFVKATSRAGGYIFDMMQKGYTSHEQGYKVRDNVPEYKKYFVKKLIGGQVIFEEDHDREITKTELIDLLRYVGATEDLPGSVYTVDYQSLVEYYTICMVFGMVDSVQKNLTIKTWDGKKFYFTFYDMDTCLGIDNDANNSTYYAFSDLWENSDSETSGDTVKLTKPVSIFRDHFSPTDTFTPSGQKLVGYDVPSSYAFAVAKYFKSFTKEADRMGLEISPASLWAMWRNKKGVLRNADYFIDNFYLNYMKDVNELMFNYNYRQKYLRKVTTLSDEGQTSYGFNYRDVPKFHGRRTEYVRDWLTGRFHIMDAYLNITCSPVPLNLTAENYSYLEAMPEQYELDSDNEDIYVLRDIFSSGSNSVEDHKYFVVQAPDFSPLVINRGTGSDRYILPDSRKKYSIYVSNAGTNKIILGGSALWTYLNSINGVIQKNMAITSNRLKNINGTEGTVESWQLNLPALEDLSLTSSGYSGNIKFDASGKDSYPNLTTIDISNSNISLTVIKEGVKKIVLNKVGATANSAPSVNITDCFNLNEVLISDAKLYSLVISPVWSDDINFVASNTNNNGNNNIKKITLVSSTGNSVLNISDFGLEELNVNNFSKIIVHDCPELQRIVITGNSLTELSILQGAAPNLTSVTIEDCSKLRSLSLNGCMNLSELTLTGGIENITSLDLSRTKIGKIHYSNTSSSDNCLDLSSMTSLEKLTIRGNPSVYQIRVRNDENNPVEFNAGRVIVNNITFNSSNLVRVFGHIRITTTGALSGLSQSFRLLPNNWKGENPSSSNKTPLQVVAGLSDVEPPKNGTDAEIESNHDDICEAFDQILNGTSSESLFDNGSSATNITFGTDEGIGEVLNSICASTPIPQFEIYYILNAFAVSAKKCENRGKSVRDQSLSLSFWYNGYDRFNYGSGKHPNRYMFYGCSKITSFGTYCISTTAESTKLLSPSHNSSGEIICDNGLFSPLINLNSIGNLVDAKNVYISRFLFRRKDGKKYPIKGNIEYFQTRVVCDEVDNNTKSYIDTLVTNNSDENPTLAGFGDFTDFFLDFAGTSGNRITIRQSFSPTYINFDTIDFPERLKIKEVINSFNPTYGCGTVNLFDQNKKIFKYTADIEQIVKSFIVESANIAYQSAVNKVKNTSYDTGGKVLFPIKDGMFTGYTKLKHIGATGGSIDSQLGYTDISRDNSINKETSLTITGFSGNGLLKYIDQANFPYDLFTVLGATLESCPGFLSNLTTYAGSLNETFNFPGSLFEKNTNLKNIAAFLKNCKIPYRLTSGGFSNCTKLQNISEIFYGELGANDECSRLEGSIPNKLFYHGGVLSNNSTENYFYGTDNEINLDSPPSIENYMNDDHKATVVFPKKFTYYSEIFYAYAAFRGCANITPYSFEIKEDFGKVDPEEDYVYTENGKIKLNVLPEYVNYNYTHWKYYIVGGQWRKGDTNPLDISSVYDGNIEDVDSSIQEISTCEEDFKTIKPVGGPTDIEVSGTTNKNENITNFFAPPDLFSYFKNNALTNIQYIFSYCGLPASSGISFQNFSKTITGRICPYLLKPLSEISSIAGMFMYCSGLSSVRFAGIEDSDEIIDGLSTYLIPPKFFYYATKISYLPRTFSGLCFEHLPAINVFSHLTKNLDIRGIFAWCMYTRRDRIIIDPETGIEKLETEAFIPISSTFMNNSLSYISGAFSSYPVTLKSYSNQDGGIGVDMYSGITNRTATFQLFKNNFPRTVRTRMAYTYNVYRGHGSAVAEDENVYNVTPEHSNY